MAPALQWNDEPKLAYGTSASKAGPGPGVETFTLLLPSHYYQIGACSYLHIIGTFSFAGTSRVKGTF
jgi:hypothetical protein